MISWKKHILGGIGALGVICMALLPLLSLPVAGKDDLSVTLEKNLAAFQPFGTLPTEAPTIEKPEWYYKTVVYYSVSQNGAVGADMSEFASLANQTLNDSRGWSRLGARFEQVTSGGSFQLILSEASLLPSYSSGCSADWSCNVGNKVIINEDRWNGASASWNAAGGSLRDYRHMVVNHETGHWLGHGHEFCGGAGQAAPVMQQQSIDLQGCSFNPWPLESELWTSRF